MAKKKLSKQHYNSLWFLLILLLLAFGFALIVQGVIFQYRFGFKHGFFAYLLAFLVIFFAMLCKAKAFRKE